MTEKYTIRVLPAAEKTLRKLHPNAQKRIAVAIGMLAKDPHPPLSTPIVGPRELFRVRVGDYRLIYAIDGNELVIIVVALGHRKDVYRRLPG